MFHFLEYPFSRGSTHITSPSAYDAPDFDAGFMNDKRDMAPMVWGMYPPYAPRCLNLIPHLLTQLFRLHQVP